MTTESRRRGARAAPWSAQSARWAERRLLNPQMRVRVTIGRGWRAGTARTLDDDDPFARLDTLCAALRPMRRLAAAILRFSVRLLDTEPVTVRIDLDPRGAERWRP